MFRAMPSFQRYRIFQEVNNLEWTTSTGRNRLIDFPEGRDAVIALLEKPGTKSGKVVFSKMKRELRRRDIAEGTIIFNFETPKRNGFVGNATSHIMRDENCVGTKWDQWSLEEQDKFVSAMLEKKPDERRPGEMREQRDDEVKQCLIEDYGLTEYAAENCLNATTRLDDGTANLSLKAAGLMLEKMEKGIMIQSDAVQAVAKEKPDLIHLPVRGKRGVPLIRSYRIAI